jgi:hypothetical protein
MRRHLRHLITLVVVLLAALSAHGQSTGTIPVTGTGTVTTTTNVALVLPTGCTYKTAPATPTVPLTITVTCGTGPAPLALTHNPVALSSFTPGTAYSANLAAAAGVTGGVPPYKFTAVASSMPPWATLSAAGVIAGLPPINGSGASFTISYTVTDSSTTTVTPATKATLYQGATLNAQTTVSSLPTSPRR